VSPDVVEAIGRLRAKGLLTERQAAPLLRVAKGELVSVELELKAGLYAGVLLVAGGAGVFLKENHDRIGPAAIGTLLGAAALACLLFAWRRLPPFSWNAAPSPHLAADYVLLLGVLLASADLAYLESQFDILGRDWPYHLLLVSLLCLLAAYRFDSRAVLSLALTSFAAWRGVTVSLQFAAAAARAVPAVRANALGCGILFVAAGISTARTRRKPHFEPVWTTLGLLLFFGGVLSGVFQPRSSAWGAWLAVLVLSGAGVLAVSYRLRRSLDFALAVVALDLGLLRVLGELLSGQLLFLVVAASSLGLIAFLIQSHRRMKGPA
jgi:hypothetical protein